MPYSYKDFTVYSWKDISDEDKNALLSIFASITEKCNEQKTVKQCDLNVVRRYFIGEIAGHACALPYRHRLGRDQTLAEYIDSLISYLLEEMIDTGLLRAGFESVREDNELYLSVKEFIR